MDASLYPYSVNAGASVSRGTTQEEFSFIFTFLFRRDFSPRPFIYLVRFPPFRTYFFSTLSSTVYVSLHFISFLFFPLTSFFFPRPSSSTAVHVSLHTGVFFFFFSDLPSKAMCDDTTKVSSHREKDSFSPSLYYVVVFFSFFAKVEYLVLAIKKKKKRFFRCGNATNSGDT